MEPPKNTCLEDTGSKRSGCGVTCPLPGAEKPLLLLCGDVWLLCRLGHFQAFLVFLNFSLIEDCSLIKILLSREILCLAAVCIYQAKALTRSS